MCIPQMVKNQEEFDRYSSLLVIGPVYRDAYTIVDHRDKDRIFSLGFSSIIRYKNLNQFLNEDKVKLWLNHNIEDGVKPFYKDDGAQDNVFYKRKARILLRLLRSDSDVNNKFTSSLISIDGRQLSTKKSVF